MRIVVNKLHKKEDPRKWIRAVKVGEVVPNAEKIPETQLLMFWRKYIPFELLRRMIQADGPLACFAKRFDVEGESTWFLCFPDDQSHSATVRKARPWIMVQIPDDVFSELPGLPLLAFYVWMEIYVTTFRYVEGAGMSITTPYYDPRDFGRNGRRFAATESGVVGNLVLGNLHLSGKAIHKANEPIRREASIFGAASAAVSGIALTMLESWVWGMEPGMLFAATWMSWLFGMIAYGIIFGYRDPEKLPKGMRPDVIVIDEAALNMMINESREGRTKAWEPNK